VPAPEDAALPRRAAAVERRRRWRGPAAQPVVPWLPPGRAVTLPGRGETFVRELGGGAASAPTVVLLHGWTVSADLNWFRLYPALCSSGRVVALDHRGHGRGIRSEVPFTLEDAADDVAVLLDVLGLAPAVLVGYSMGGPIAMLTWQRHRGAVAGLVLEATALDWRSTRRERLRWRTMGLLELVLRLDANRGFTERLLRRAVQHAPDLEPYVGWVAAELRRADPAEMAAAGRALAAYDARPFAGRVDVPTAVVVTARDHLVRPGKQRALAAAIPSAAVFSVPGDHDAALISVEAFAATTTAALGWVSDRVTAAAAPVRAASRGGAGSAG
jgi:pimeloyl-ACP methyl ester carboxylesterase